MGVVAVLMACAAQGGQAPDSAQASGIQVLRGQWLFLKSSTAFCVEKVPAMKGALDNARDHAEETIARAERRIAIETDGREATYKPLIEAYAGTWTEYAETLIDGLKRQDAAKACPTLLDNWQAADVDLILEDWQGFLDRNAP